MAKRYETEQSVETPQKDVQPIAIDCTKEIELKDKEISKLVSVIESTKKLYDELNEKYISLKNSKEVSTSKIDYKFKIEEMVKYPENSFDRLFIVLKHQGKSVDGNLYKIWCPSDNTLLDNVTENKLVLV